MVGMLFKEEAVSVIKEKLGAVGVCDLCMLRYLGEATPAVYKKYRKTQEDSTLQDTEDGTIIKKKKGNHCVVCLGLLQYLCGQDLVIQLKDKVVDSGWVQCDAISLYLSVPACLAIRHRALWMHLQRTLPQYYKTISSSQVTNIKKVWKWMVAGRVATLLLCKVKESGGVEINTHVKYDKDQEECRIVEQLYHRKPKKRWNRKKKKKEAEDPLITRCVVETQLNQTESGRLAELLQIPPSVPDEGVSLEKIVCTFDSIYIAGRYQKFSRQLSQTPWVVEGERRMETSVQELICDKIQRALGADDIVFASSGREDVDVRAIGLGRPFYCECQNSRKTLLKRQDTLALQREINASTDLIAVRDLQVVAKSDTIRLKEGEEKKKKTYRALCRAARALTPQDFVSLKKTGIDLKQKTPVRVIHRRPVAERTRTVHAMEAAPLDTIQDPTLFTLDVTTQAGTYVKEFVHGDFGRTTPSLRDFLGCSVDILALDVTEVLLDWPPRLHDPNS